jgi:hypothetical protein
LAAPDTGPGSLASSTGETETRVRALSPIAGCLLTDLGGVARDPASQIWAGLQDAAADVHARASFVPLPKKTAPAAIVNSLVASRCDVILAVGAAPVAAVKAVAAKAPAGVRFAVPGKPTGALAGFAPTRESTRTVVAELFADLPKDVS